jgi:hypothetical protein
MYDDLINKPKEYELIDGEEGYYYICEVYKLCPELCLHKVPHGKKDLGRPEHGLPTDCSIEPCQRNGAVCRPLKNKEKKKD